MSISTWVVGVAACAFAGLLIFLWAYVRDQRKKASAPPKAQGCLFLIMLVVGGIYAAVAHYWKSSQASRATPVVRRVFLRGHSLPEIYMNDGTVWRLYPAGGGDLIMIRGDKVRYASNFPRVSENWRLYPSGEKIRHAYIFPMVSENGYCYLKDVTTGYKVVGHRISAPFKHSSCPAK